MSQLVQADEILTNRVLEGTYEIWSEGLSRESYRRFWQAQIATPWGRRQLTRWALVDGQDILSSAKLYRFNAELDGRAIQVAGVGAVFTPQEHRGHGAAATLITMLLDHVRRDGCDLAMLFSEIGPEYYARLGFEAVPLSDLTLRVVEDQRRGAPAMMVRSGEDRDLADIVAMDAARASTARFHLLRDREQVKFAIAKRRLLTAFGPIGAREVQFFVAEEGASAVAYVVIAARRRGAPWDPAKRDRAAAAAGVDDAEWMIDSCGDRDPAGARLGGILQVLIAREPSRQRPIISAWLPESLRPPQIEIVHRRPSRDVMMIKPLNDRGRPDRPLTAADIAYWRGDAF